MSFFYDTNQGFPTEVYQTNENPSIFYPVVNQVYVPESRFYKVVHAIVYNGTTYFYESIMDFPIYHVYNTISYTPANNVGGNASYWPVENIYNDDVDGHIENISDSDCEPSFVERLPLENNVSLPYENNVSLPAEKNVTLPAENNMTLLPSVNTSTFFSPELDADTSVPNNFWSSAVEESQYDTVENCHRNVNEFSKIYRSSYSDQFVTWNVGTVCYQEVNYGLYQFSYDTSLEDGSANETMQAPALSLEALEKNAAKAYVKYRKDCIYLTALSGKLYQKNAIPAVKKMPVIPEVDDKYPEKYCCSNDIEHVTQKKSIVEANTVIKDSKVLNRRKKVTIVEKSSETPTLEDIALAWGIETISVTPTLEDMALALGNEKISEAKQQVDLASRENILTHLSKKSFIVAQNTLLLEENYSKNQLAEYSQNFLSEMNQNLSTFEEKTFRIRTEKTSRKVKKQNIKEMRVVQEMNVKNELVESGFFKMHEIRFPSSETDIVIQRSKKYFRKERSQVDETSPITDEVNDEGYQEVTSKENLLKIENSVVCKNIYSERNKKCYKKESFQVLEKIEKAENEDYMVVPKHAMVRKRKGDKIIVRPNLFSTRSMKLHRRDEIMPLVQDTVKKVELSETNETEDHDGFIGNKGDIKENLLAHEKELLSKIIEIPQAESTNADNLLHSVDISPVLNEEKTSLDKYEEIKNHKMADITDVDVPEKSFEENPSFTPVSEKVDLKDSQESETALRNDSEATKAHSKKPKKKRFRRFLDRLLCCCTKGPT